MSKLIQWVGNSLFMLLVFLFVADPTNTILGLKTPVFALLLLYSLVFFKADWKNIVYFIVPVIIEKGQKLNKLRASYICCLALLNGHFLIDCQFLYKF